jgi:hypothetical protein
MARHMAHDLGLTAHNKEELGPVLGQQAAAAINKLVATAMLAWLRVNGSGEGQRISTMGAGRGHGSCKRGLPALTSPARRCACCRRAFDFPLPAGDGGGLLSPRWLPCPPAGPAAVVHPELHNVRMTVDPAPPFHDVAPARPGQTSWVLLICKPGVLARRQAQAAEEGEDVEEAAREWEQAMSYKVVVQADVVASVPQVEGGEEGDVVRPAGAQWGPAVAGADATEL